MQIVVSLIFAVVGRFLIGGSLAFLLGHKEDQFGNIQENKAYGFIGMLVGAIVGAWIYSSSI